MEAWAKTLDELDQTLNTPTLPYTQLDKVRRTLEAMREEIDQFVDALTPKLDAAKAQVDNLGAAPATGEPEAVASQRAELEKAFGSLSAARNIAESTRLRANQIASHVQDIRRKRFASRLFERVPDAHESDTWINAPSQLSYAVQKAGDTVAGWWEHTDRRLDIVQLLVLAMLLAGATAYVSHRGIKHFRSWTEPTEPPIWKRATSAAWVILLRVLPYAATSAFLYYGMKSQGLMPDDIDRLAYSAMRSTLIVAAVAALVTTALAPRSPHWRLLPMSNEAAERIRWLVVALASVYSHHASPGDDPLCGECTIYAFGRAELRLRDYHRWAGHCDLADGAQRPDRCRGFRICLDQQAAKALVGDRGAHPGGCADGIYRAGAFHFRPAHRDRHDPFGHVSAAHLGRCVRPQSGR